MRGEANRIHKLAILSTYTYSYYKYQVCTLVSVTPKLGILHFKVVHRNETITFKKNGLIKNR